MMTVFEKYLGYDRPTLAKAIAWYMTANGSLNTTEGNWVYSFAEIDELFGTDLEKGDVEMARMIEDELDPNILLIDDMTLSIPDKEFDLNFGLMYAPNAWEGECHE